MARIMLIEDDHAIRNELKEFLQKYGHEILAPAGFDGIIQYIENENPDLILLDINLPVFDGYHICREIRKKSDVPIIMVTSRDSNIDELMSMNLGADDFVAKPYDPQILLAHIVSVLKRSGKTSNQQVLKHGGLALNLANGTISYGENVFEVTKNEIRILSCLIQNAGKIVSRDDLMNYMWSMDAFIDDNNLTVNISRLRKKLEDAGIPQSIETRRGLGYILT